jgi:tRNA A37 threonylcarbamoyladenosine dehydratase
LSILIGEDALKNLCQCHVAVFGVGGVGSWCAEALVRSGISKITLVDSDRIAPSNINRQLPALLSTVGELKAEVLAARLRSIREGVTVRVIASLYSQSTRNGFAWDEYDYVIDAIDSLCHKTDLLIYASERGCTVFSSLGAAGKLDPTKVRSASIWKTAGCPLGRLVRVGLRKHGFSGDFMAVYSEEPSREGYLAVDVGICESKGNSIKQTVLGSFVSVTATFGMTLASLVVQDVFRRESAD